MRSDPLTLHKRVSNVQNRDHYQEGHEYLNPHLRFQERIMKPGGVIDRVLQTVLPLSIPEKGIDIRYLSSNIDEPDLCYETCIQNGLTYNACINATLEVVHSKGSFCMDVPLFSLPLLTRHSSLVINGHEKVMILYLKKSSGIFFSTNVFEEQYKSSVTCKIIPDSGQWMYISLDQNRLNVVLRKGPKLPTFAVLLAMGCSAEKIFNNFSCSLSFYTDSKGRLYLKEPEQLIGKSLTFPLLNAEGVVTISANHLIRKEDIEDLRKIDWSKNVSHLYHKPSKSLVQVTEGELAGGERSLTLVCPTHNLFSFMHEESSMFSEWTTTEARIYLYQLYNPGLSKDKAAELADNFYRTFFGNIVISQHCRDSINMLLRRESEANTLEPDDILSITKMLSAIQKQEVEASNTNDLSNRVVVSFVDSLYRTIQNPTYKLMQALKSRLLETEDDEVSIRSKIRTQFARHNTIPSAVQDIYIKSSHCQMLDEVNPLSMLTHQRKLTVLSRLETKDQVSASGRDIIPSYYGRICVNETPEGQSIGLINTLAYGARIASNGLLEAPFIKIKDGQVTDEVIFMNSKEEDRHITVAYVYKNNRIDGYLPDMTYTGRHNGQIIGCTRSDIEYMNWSPNHIFSMSSSLIPFVHHNDANRVLMGSNMQRQAIPLVRKEAPLVGTGFESMAAHASSVCLEVQSDGYVRKANAEEVIIEHPDSQDYLTFYRPRRPYMSNKGIWVHEDVTVESQTQVSKGQKITTYSSIKDNELAIGQNVLIAYMSYYGNNFEDSIVVSRKLIEQDKFHSISCKKFVCVAHEGKIGQEEITRDIPTVSEVSLAHLDEDGIIQVGSIVKPGDILVGKITPKAHNKPTPEEKLLMAIFGEKSFGFSDTSLRVPENVYGKVIDVYKYNPGKSIDEEIAAIESKINYIDNSLRDMLVRKRLTDNTSIKASDLKRQSTESLFKLPIKNKQTLSLLKKAQDQHERLKERINTIHKRRASICNRMSLSNDLCSKIVVVVAHHLSLQTGDKLAGRHGNKGIVSKVVATEDMPYMIDGTPIDMIVTPIGVPSRMNIGQLFETILGLISRELGKRIKAQLYDSAVAEVRGLLNFAYNTVGESNIDISQYTDEEVITLAKKVRDGVPFTVDIFSDSKGDKYITRALGKVGLDHAQTLYDGRTGNALEEKVTVGVAYMLKLNHMIENKVHARSTGPYNMITQQPIGGRNFKGGQRAGEMEVLSIQAHGASALLQEMLTVKSDSIEGRNMLYQDIVSGSIEIKPGLPESFYVLKSLLHGLGLKVDLLQKTKNK